MRWHLVLSLVLLLSCGKTTIVQGQTDTVEEAKRLHQQASDLYKQGKYTEALSLFQRSLTICEKVLGPEHPNTAGSVNNLANVYRDMGDYAHALPLFQRALAVREKVLGPEHPETAGTIYNLAMQYLGAGDYARALLSFQHGLSVGDKALANVFAVASEEQKLKFVQQLQASYFTGLAFIRVYLASDPTALRLGLEWILRRKGIVLTSQARTQQMLATRLHGDELAAWQRLTQHRSELSRLLLINGSPQDPANYRRTVDDLRAAITREEEWLAQRTGVVTQELAQRRVTVQLLAERLPPKSALIEFVSIPDFDAKKNKWLDTYHYLAFVLTPDAQVTLVDVGEGKKVNTAIWAALVAIADPTFRHNLKAYGSSVDAQLADLYTLLLRPLEGALGGCQRLIVSPDGELSKVPFAALRTPDGHYLIEKMTISYVASGRDLLRGDTGEKPTTDLLLVANPAFDDQEVLKKATLDTDAVRAGDYSGRFESLPGTAEEARMIPSLLSGTQKVLQGKEATESAVRAVSSPRVLHLATHGFFLKDEELAPPEKASSESVLRDARERDNGGITTVATAPPKDKATIVNPMVRSGLALAGANHAKEITTGDDGILTALEVTGMNLYGTDLVVLSACETGLGDVQVGEGVYGLRRAFVLAGAKNLVMSLWAANDKIMLDQMKAFYQGYGKGKTPTVALCEAQLQTIASLREQTKASIGEPIAPVKLWAPFIVQQTAESSATDTAANSSTTSDTDTSAPTLDDGQERGKGGTEQLPTQEIPKPESVALKVDQQDGVAGYHRWNLIVPLLALIGLLVLSRVHISVVPAEATSLIPPHAVTAEQPVPYARFVCQRPGNGLPREIALIHDDLVLGSGTDCDVFLRHPSIATRHARVQWRKQGYVLIDLQSATGTYINGRRITENLLKEGWRVRLGEIEFVFYEAKTHV